MQSSTQKPDAHQNQYPTQQNSSQSPQSKQPAQSKWLPHEERLGKAWRVIGTTVANCLSKAEKATAPISDNASRTSTSAKETSKRELDESVVLFLRTRREFHRLLSHTEAKLQGKAEEMESLDCYVRTQPRIGTRKRKR